MPGWKRSQPPGIKKVFHCETEFALAGFRTQLFNPRDLDNVKKVQAGYKAQPLSQFLGKPAPPAAPTIDFIKPLSPDQERTLPEFFNILNFVLEFCPTNPSEKELMVRFAKLNIGAGKNFDVAQLSPEVKKAVGDGVADAWEAFAEAKRQVDAGRVIVGDFFGTRGAMDELEQLAARLMAAVRSMPPGQQRQDALKEIGRLRFRMGALLRSTSSSQVLAKIERSAVAKRNG